MGLTERAHITAGALSHGERQWLEIAMLLSQEPKLLLVDEPAAGMTDTGYDALDAAALKIADRMRFSPAANPDRAQ